MQGAQQAYDGRPQAATITPAGAGGAAPMYSGLQSNQDFMANVDPNDPRTKTPEFQQYMQGRQTAVSGQQQPYRAQPVQMTAPPPPTSVVTGQPLFGAPAQQMMAPPTASNPALDATYAGRSGGKQWYTGADGKQYTNKDREKALEGQDTAQESALAGQVQGQITGSLTNQQRSRGALEQALNGNAGDIGRVRSYQPVNSMGFDPSRLESMTATGNDAMSFDRLGDFQSYRTDAVDTGGLDNFQSTALQGVNTGALKNSNAGQSMQRYLSETGGFGGGADPSISASASSYDAMKSVNEYARGAAGQAKFALDDALRAQENSAAAGGRLDTGLFDRDKGMVVQNVGRDLNDRISQAAVQAAGIQAGIENNNASLGTQASIAQGNLRGDLMRSREGYRSNEAQSAAQLGQQALTNALGIDADTARSIDGNRLTATTAGTNARLDKARTSDNNRLAGVDSASRLELNQKQFGDTFRQTNTRDALDMGMKNNQFLDSTQLDALVKTGQLSAGQAELLSSMNQFDTLTTNDLMASERDRILGRRNQSTAQSQQREQNKMGLWGAGIGAVANGAAAYAGRA